MALNQLGLGFEITAKDFSEGVMRKVSGNMADMSEAAEKAGERIKEVGEQTEKVGASLAAVGIGGLVFLGISAAKADELDESLKAVAAQTNETIFPMERMEELAGDLAVRFGTMPIEQTRAMFQAVQQGARSASDAEALLTSSNELAKVGHIELNQALMQTSQLLKVFGLGFENASKVTDMLREAALQGNVAVGDLGVFVEHLGPSAVRAGLSIEELLGAVGALGKAGISGRPAMSGLAGVIESIVQPSKEAAAEAARLGVQFNATAVQTKGLPEVLREVSASSAFNKTSLEKLFGSIQAGTVAMSLMKDKGRALADAVEDIGHSFGKTAAEADALVQPDQRFSALKEHAMELIGKAILPLTDAIYGIVNAFLAMFTKIPAPVMSVVVGIAALAFGFLFVAGTAVAAAGAFLALEGALAPLLATTLTILGAVAALAIQFVLIAAPIALAVYAMKVAFDRNLGGIRDLVVGFYEKVKLTWDALVQVFRDGGFSGAVLKDLDKAGNGGIQNFVIQIFTTVKRIQAFFEGIGHGFSEAMDAMAPVFETLQNAFRELGNLIAQAFGGENDPKSNAEKFYALKDAGESVGHAIAAVVKVGAYWLTGMVKLVVGVIEAIQWAVRVWGEFKDAASSVFAVIMAPLERIAELIGKLAKFDLGLLKSAGEALGLVPGEAAKASHGGQQAVPLTFLEPTGGAAQGAALASQSPGVAAARAALARVEAGQGSAADRELVQSNAAILKQLQENANKPVILNVDGETLGEVVAKHQASSATRTFAAQPLPG